jgi:predicted transcriptional regulator
MDLDSFHSLGLSATEARVYLWLIENGSSPVQKISRKLSLPRSTVYSALDSLVQRGMISKGEKKGASFFSAEDVQAIVRMVERDKESLVQRELIARHLVKQISPLLRKSAVSLPALEVAEGKRNVEQFLFRMLPIWRDSILATDNSTWGYQDHTFVEVFPKWIKECWKVLHIEAGIPGRILSNQSAVEAGLKGKVPGREVRVLDDTEEFSTSTWVMGNYIILIMTRQEPFYLFQVHDRALSANLRALFKRIYNSAGVVSAK